MTTDNAELVRRLEQADEGLANAYSSTHNDYDKDRLACERIGLQKAIKIVRAAALEASAQPVAFVKPTVLQSIREGVACVSDLMVQRSAGFSEPLYAAPVSSELEATRKERDEARLHTRKQAEDIMTLGKLVYDAADPPVKWKTCAETAESALAEANRKLDVARDIIACVLDEYDNTSGPITDENDPHWSNDARRFLSQITNAEGG